MIPADLHAQNAMLATPCKDPDGFLAAAQPGQLTFDIKWDGNRCLAFICDGVVTLKSRLGGDITAKYPEVVARLLELYPTGERVFDGEILCFDAVTGQPSFNRMQHRSSQSSEAKIALAALAHPATFMAFDFLWLDGDDLRNTALAGRQALLAVEGSNTFGTDQRVMVSQWSDDGATLWKFVCDFGMEGLIAKDKRSTYRGRRDSAWTKLKRTHRLSALVTGYEEGKGARRGRVGALLVSLLDDNGKLVPVGKVGTGFKEHDHAPMLECLHRGEEFIVEVEYMSFEKKALRMPSYKGVRTDVTRSDCTLAQIR